MSQTPDSNALDVALRALVQGQNNDPFAVLGPHQDPAGGVVVRTYQPNAVAVVLMSLDGARPLASLEEDSQIPGLFTGHLDQAQPYLLAIDWPQGQQITEDPYSFGTLLSDMDIYLFSEGNHRNLGRCLGAQYMQVGGVAGVRFAVWAPNAQRVSVVGNFNSWDGRRHPMRARRPAGIWEIFIPRLQFGEIYKYEIVGPDGQLLPLRADPIALQTELPPATGSVVAPPADYPWQDQHWVARRPEHQALDQPLAIYELHAGSWRRHQDGSLYNWGELADELIPYLDQLGFTHIELMPIMEHPFGGSWGYQPLSLFAPSARYGSPREFASFVDRLHQAGIGVILDWVPAHFPDDEHGLRQFDGTALYEYGNPQEGFHPDWNTYIYNLGRTEVHGFMLASALHWLREYHVDGLRVDAVASMLYRDYSRKAGEWVPNAFGGRENLEAVAFLRHLNQVVAEEVPGALMIAEESTAWPGVTESVEDGGLGFSYKWNMGWMHDTLAYFAQDPVYRSYHHDKITFGLVYAFSEHFIVPISHDEVVYGKHSLIDKMPGDCWQKFANARAFLAFMWSHPGKKLLFMGSEFGQWREWDHDRGLDWYLLDSYPDHQGLHRLVVDLNLLYRQHPALHQQDDSEDGFQWLVVDDTEKSVFAWLRLVARDEPLLVVVNATPVVRHNYRIGVPRDGFWKELLNTDAECYGGSNVGNEGGMMADNQPCNDQPHSLNLRLPPLAVLFLRPE